MDHCKLSASDGHTAEKAMDERVQSLWNAVLDECGAKQEQLLQELEREQQQLNLGEEGGNDDVLPSEKAALVTPRKRELAVAAGHDSRGETSEESNEELSSNSGSDAPEVVTGNDPLVNRADSTAERNTRTTCQDVLVHQSEVTPNSLPIEKEEKRKSSGANGSVAVRTAARTAVRTSGRRVPVRARSAASKRPLMSLGQMLEEIAEPHLAKFSEAERELWGWHRGNLEISCGAVSSVGRSTMLLRLLPPCIGHLTTSVGLRMMMRCIHAHS